jgi:hypothetical protein
MDLDGVERAKRAKLKFVHADWSHDNNMSRAAVFLYNKKPWIKHETLINI